MAPEQQTNPGNSQHPLSEMDLELHNQLYGRAADLLKGLVILDGQNHRAPGFFAKRKLRKAIGIFQQVLELNPVNWSAMFFSGKAFQAMSEHEAALSCFLRAHECAPDNPSVAKELGFAAGKLGRHDLVVQVLEPVATRHPENAGLQCNLGLSALMSGKSALAVSAFARAVELEPNMGLNRQLLALAKEVEAGGRNYPRTEAEITQALKSTA